MFFPINTDAPLYHRPIGTIGLIVANWITYALTNGGHAHEGWILTFGQGMHPLEWVSSAFLHFGIMHLLGNMLFLWSYGLIIEGKIGTFWFLLTYFAMCLIHGAIVQSVMLWADPVGGAGGASGVIFAMLAIVLVWAPLNTFDVVWSEDSFLHSGNRQKVMQELYRVLKKGGELIFTDPMQSPDAQKKDLQPVLDRIHLETMGSFEFYKKAAKDLGMEVVQILDLSHQLPEHYSRVAAELKEKTAKMSHISKEYVDRMLQGLAHWVEAGKKGALNWGILHFRK